jgi:hypothetical protein
MSRRLRPVFAALAGLLALAAPAARAAADGNAEAQRLYERANDYVTAITEGKYSYAYIQFYWKRTNTNLDWIQQVYPDTPVGRKLRAGELKVGAFALDYFRGRVLPKLEEKRQATVDAIACAIYLCELKGPLASDWDDNRRAAVARIIEALSRQKRWGEALKFPVLEADEAAKRAVIFRVAARYEQDDLVKELLANTPADQLTATRAILGEALALRGRDRTEITKLLDEDPSAPVKRAVLSGMALREARIQLAARTRVPVEKAMLLGDTIKRSTVRDDVDAVARTFFPSGDAAADAILVTYRAALGTKPAAAAPASAHEAYLEYLAAVDRLPDATAYAADPSLPAAARTAAALKAIELLAAAGQSDAAEAARARLAASGIPADQSVLALFRGRMNSTEVPLVVRQFTLSDVPFRDPAVAAQAIMEWSLTPNRSIRGASPYDSLVQKFDAGFVNLPEPKSQEAAEAARVQKQF